MPDYSPEYYLPDDSRVLGWCKEALQEGERINKSDPAYQEMDKQISYVMGIRLLEITLLTFTK